MKLSNFKCDKAEEREKSYKLSDGGGLYLEILPNGSKSWRLKYRFQGKEKRLVISLYPTITLAKARKARDEARLQKAPLFISPCSHTILKPLKAELG